MPTTNGVPDQAGTIRGLAQAPLHLQNMVAELVDNALAANPTGIQKVYVDLSPHEDGGDDYVLRVWDGGPGISLQRLEQDVFQLGHPPGGVSHLNEHGFGLKNVLAKAEQLSGKTWSFRTRDADALAEGRFYECKRPFSFAMPIELRPSGEWPIYAPQTTGTICEIVVPMTYMQSVAFGRRGALPGYVGRIMDYLREHLGVLYRGYLEGGVRAATQIFTSTGLGQPDHVDAVSPDFKSKDTFNFSLTLSNQQVQITGVVGLVDKDSPQTKSRLLYYKHAPESQGIDIRVGKRTVATRLISEVWEKDRHPSLNGVAGEFIIPGTRGIAPPTLNNKTSIDFDGLTWHAIVEGIQQAMPADELPHGGGKSEDDLRDELFQHINGLKRPTHTLETEYDCTHGIAIDILWDQTPTGGSLDIFEVKKGKAAPIDLYQLVMYWDSLVTAGKQPTYGHLVSSGRTTGVNTLLSFLRARTDASGNPYNLVVEDWAAHGITP
jgi:hypothetical protein